MSQLSEKEVQDEGKKPSARIIPAGRIVRSPHRPSVEGRPSSSPWTTRGWGGLDPVIGKMVQGDTMTAAPHEGFPFKPFTAVNGGSELGGVIPTTGFGRMKVST